MLEIAEAGTLKALASTEQNLRQIDIKATNLEIRSRRERNQRILLMFHCLGESYIEIRGWDINKKTNTDIISVGKIV